jgi:hypothetical protein
MINQTAKSGEDVSVKELENMAADFFSPAGSEIKRRINEQISLGNMDVKEDKVFLTVRGEHVWKAMRVISNFFNLNSKYTG